MRHPARLTMLGDGSLHQAMLRKIRKMGLSDVVATPGYVPVIDPWLRRPTFPLHLAFRGRPAVAVEGSGMACRWSRPTARISCMTS
jgi:hypothetical protein